MLHEWDRMELQLQRWMNYYGGGHGGGYGKTGF
jgi:hypothetical protein